MKLEYLMTYRATLNDAVEIGTVPLGRRRIIDVTGGSFEGPKLRGTILASGADWLMTGPDAVTRLDVRATFQTDDGAFIYASYRGVSAPSETVREKRARGEDPDFGDAYFMTSPVFENR